jgi:hypothetical protein
MPASIISFTTLVAKMHLPQGPDYILHTKDIRTEHALVSANKGVTGIGTGSHLPLSAQTSRRSRIAHGSAPGKAIFGGKPFTAETPRPPRKAEPKAKA